MDGEDVIDLTGSDDTPVNKRAANETQVQVSNYEAKALETVLKMIKCVRERANTHLDTGRPIGDTPVPEPLVAVARELNRMYTAFAGPYLTPFGDRWTELGAQQTLACMSDRDDSRPFGQLIRALREDE